MSNKATHGGSRNGSGRPKLTRKKKKVAVAIYVEGEKINAVGGIDNAKQIARCAINEQAEKN